LLNTLVALIFGLLFCLTYLGLKALTKWKKLFIFANIVFATLLSPPDVLNQLLLLSFFTLLLELALFVLTFYFKIRHTLKRQ